MLNLTRMEWNRVELFCQQFYETTTYKSWWRKEILIMKCDKRNLGRTCRNCTLRIHHWDNYHLTNNEMEWSYYIVHYFKNKPIKWLTRELALYAIPNSTFIGRLNGDYRHAVWNSRLWDRKYNPEDYPIIEEDDWETNYDDEQYSAAVEQYGNIIEKYNLLVSVNNISYQYFPFEAKMFPLNFNNITNIMVESENGCHGYKDN
ncbi:uncharacterized protein LOC126898152 [Daktulosphaira vitifoliae]|uniref:uncharacterized protein LOC126898152 n=1 Tax=Daktulosphaira vitifoliae TaxID=58002 RepID=UPI0021A9EEDC|nr:uncharacterized protein LOC126898152 [Daktulosphaira vitifoliae]